MIPLRDDLPTLRFPVLTVALIVINVAVFLWQWQFPTDPAISDQGLSSGIDQSALEYGAIPYRITHPGDTECALGVVPQGSKQVGSEVVCEGTPEAAEAERLAGEKVREADGRVSEIPEPIPLDQAPWWATVLTSMFLHGGILHLAGNMLFLWVFGNNIEESLGRVRFLLFYLLAGIVAVYAQAFVDTAATAPTIGASGAIAGVLGAYALLHPKARVLTLVLLPFFFTLIALPALLVLGIWFVLQFLPAIGQTAISDVSGGSSIAYLAHVGGFVFGLAAIKLFLLGRNDESPRPADPAY